MTGDSTSLLGGLDVAAFLERHWQKHPLLVRGAIPGFESPLSPEELAGLACDPDVTSRLVLEHGAQVRQGPFEERDFTALADSGWSLTVREIDQLVPAVADLLQRFRFVPNWRIDDVRADFAPRGADAGPLDVDHDVFLLQGLGRGRRQIRRDARPAPAPGDPLPADFSPEEEWVLEPGDLLYLPPGVVQRGIAVDDCLTYAIACAAPEAGELFAAFVSTAIESALDDEAHAADAHAGDPLSAAIIRRYADPDLAEPGEPGEIAAAARRRLHALMRDVLADEHTFDRWLGGFLTAPRRIGPRPPERPLADVAQALRDGVELLRSSVAHFAHAQIDGVTYLYVGGNEYPLPEDLESAAPLLSGRRPLTLRTLEPHLDNPAALELIAALIADGYLEPADPAHPRQAATDLK